MPSRPFHFILFRFVSFITRQASMNVILTVHKTNRTMAAMAAEMVG